MTAMHGTCQKNQKYTNNFLGLLLTRSSDQSGTDTEAAERFETRGAYLPLSHTHTPTQIFQNALCVVRWHRQFSQCPLCP